MNSPDSSPDAAHNATQTIDLAGAEDRLRRLLENATPAFLLGAGCSRNAQLPLISELTELVLKSERLDDESKAILQSISSSFETESEVSGGHIEDYLSELIDLLAIVDRRERKGVRDARVNIGGSSYGAGEIRQAVESIKLAIGDSVNKTLESAHLRVHRDFVKSIHRPLRSGRQNPGNPISYLVLNYDTLLEDSLALERIAYSDGMEGGATGWWELESFDRARLEARVYKLHGSVDWIQLEDHSLPRRLGPNVRSSDVKSAPILIWPASTKYSETRQDPFAQLSVAAWGSLLNYGESPVLLVVCGYSFGDAHINDELTAVLRHSGGRLTMAVFTSECCPSAHEQLQAWCEDEDLGKSILVYARRGFFHGNSVVEADEDLSWWKFEEIVKLIGASQ